MRQKLIHLMIYTMKTGIRLYASLCALFLIQPAFGRQINTRPPDKILSSSGIFQSSGTPAFVLQSTAPAFDRQISTRSVDEVLPSSGIFQSSGTPALVLQSTAPVMAAPITSSATQMEVRISSGPVTPPVRGVHITSWAAGTLRTRRNFLKKMEGTVLNTVVVAVKETDGKVYIPGVKTAHWIGSYTPAIPYPGKMLRDLKAAGLRSIARIVVFADNHLPRIRPDLAVKDPDGELWTTYKGTTWADPYMKKVWEYNVDVAARAAELGFDEIQFDYIRFPADGDTALCDYSTAYSSQSAANTLKEFLLYAGERLASSKVQVSAAVFGLTTTVAGDMGIGQKFSSIASVVDHISPMMYPSHYARGEYGIEDPNSRPYEIIDKGLRDAVKKLRENSHKLRPYLQNFSMGSRYGPEQVKAQILAAEANGVMDWLLWNPQNNYSWEALKTPEGP